MIRPAVMLNSALGMLLASAAQAATIEVPALIYRPADAPATTGSPPSAANATERSSTDTMPRGQRVTIRTPPLRYRPAIPAAAGTDAADSGPREARGEAIVIRTPQLTYRPGSAETSRPPAAGPAVVRSAPLRYRPAATSQASTDAIGMRYPEFPASAVSSPRLRIESPLTGLGEPLAVRYSGLSPDTRHMLFAWLVSEARPRIVASQRTSADESSGTWSPTLSPAGSYQICLAADERSLEARRGPERADECVTATVVWGDPHQLPRPVIETNPTEPIAGQDFTLSYRAMPNAENAKIFVYDTGADARTTPVLSVTTDGRAAGSLEPRIWQPGTYEIRVVYEMQGRQTRAVRPLRVLPREQESTR